MTSNSIDRKYFTEGYHGTDEITACKIIAEGFRKDLLHSELYLASDDQTYLAHMHGLKNAERSGQPNYGLIRVTFPETPYQESFLGPRCIILGRDAIDNLAIQGLSIFTRKGELTEGDPVEITNDYFYVNP